MQVVKNDKRQRSPHLKVAIDGHSYNCDADPVKVLLEELNVRVDVIHKLFPLFLRQFLPVC